MYIAQDQNSLLHYFGHFDNFVSRYFGMDNDNLIFEMSPLNSPEIPPAAETPEPLSPLSLESEIWATPPEITPLPSLNLGPGVPSPVSPSVLSDASPPLPSQSQPPIPIPLSRSSHPRPRPRPRPGRPEVPRPLPSRPPLPPRPPVR